MLCRYCHKEIIFITWDGQDDWKHTNDFFGCDLPGAYFAEPDDEPSLAQKVLDIWTNKDYPIESLSKAEDNLKLKIPGLEIVPAKKNELQLDYDHEEIPEQFHKMLPVLRQRFPYGKVSWESYMSSSKKHWHVIVKLPEEINDQERIVWQAVFGSDCVREGLNLLRLINHVNDPSVLYMFKDRTPVEVGEIPERPGRKFKE